MSARIFACYEYDETAEITCPACGWKGSGSAAEMEPYRELFDLSCPKCGQMLVIVSYPTVEETKEAAAAGNPKAMAELDSALEVEARWNRVAELELKLDSELPEVSGDRLLFEWDFEGDEARLEGDVWTIIRCGDVQVWRELALYEGADRFRAVKEILKARYGDRFVSLTPTEASKLYLYGDRLTTITYD